MTDTRRLVRLDAQQAKKIDELRERAEDASGVPVSFAAMVRVVVDEGTKAVLARKRK